MDPDEELTRLRRRLHLVIEELESIADALVVLAEDVELAELETQDDRPDTSTN